MASDVHFHRGFPRTLFKYRPLRKGEESFDRACEWLEGRMWAASRKSFNDPFDCQPALSIEANPKRQKRFTMGVLKRVGGGNRQERRAVYKRRHQSPDHLTFETMARNSINTTLDSAGIVSLPLVPDDLLMWGHYASEHTGICVGIEIDTSSDEFKADPPLLVAYDQSRPLLHYPEPDAKAMLEAAFLHKAKMWEYEQEWRIIHRAGPGTISWPRQRVRHVIYGARIDPDHKASLERRFGGRGHLATHQSRLSDLTYELVIEPAK